MATPSTSHITHSASFRGPLPDESKPHKIHHSYKVRWLCLTLYKKYSASTLLLCYKNVTKKCEK